MKFDTKLIGYITLFEKYTGTEVKDCFFRESELIFIVKEGQLMRAIGKNGENVKGLVAKIKHKIRVIGFDNDLTQFIKNLLYPINGFQIEKKDDGIYIIPNDTKTKGQIYGRERSNFKWVQEVLNRHFNNIEIKVG